MNFPPVIPGVVAALLLASASVASAQESQIKKADKALAAHASGDRSALEAALSAIEAAVAHKKTEGSARAWLRRAQVLRHFVLDPTLPGAPDDAAERMVASYAAALERDPSDEERRQAATDLSAVASALSTRLFDEIEGGRWEDGYRSLKPALEARELLGRLGADDVAARARLLRLAVLVTAHTRRFDEARAHHAAFVEAGEWDATVTTQLAKRLKDVRGVEDALAFLGPVGQQRPDDSTVLNVEVDLLLEAGDREAAHTRLDAAAAALDGGVGSQLMLAALYHRAGDGPASRAAYQRVLDRDPNVQEALLPMARFLVADATAPAPEDGDGAAPEGGDEADPPAGEPAEVAAEEAPPLSEEALQQARTEAWQAAVELLERRRQAVPSDREALELLVQAYAALERADDEAQARKALELLTR